MQMAIYFLLLLFFFFRWKKEKVHRFTDREGRSFNENPSVFVTFHIVWDSLLLFGRKKSRRCGGGWIEILHKCESFRAKDDVRKYGPIVTRISEISPCCFSVFLSRIAKFSWINLNRSQFLFLLVVREILQFLRRKKLIKMIFNKVISRNKTFFGIVIAIRSNESVDSMENLSSKS